MDDISNLEYYVCTFQDYTNLLHYNISSGQKNSVPAGLFCRKKWKSSSSESSSFVLP